MRGSAVVAALLAVAIGGCPAEARVKAGPGVNPGWHKLGAAAGSALDLFTTPTAAYSFRKLKSTYAGSAVRLRRASDNAELDVGFLGFVPGLGSPFDVAAANAHCAATSCFVRTWYDQSGAALDMAQATAAAQLLLVFNCQGALPCAQATDGTQFVATANVTPVSPVSLSTVGGRTIGVGSCQWRQNALNNRIQGGTANQLWLLSTGTIVGTATDGVWHAAGGVINGASSVLNIDGVETTGTVTAATTVGPTQLAGAATTTCRFSEFVIWNGYALTAAERTALTNNQRSFWGF